MKKTTYIILIICFFIIVTTSAGCIDGSYAKTETVLTKLDSSEKVQWTTVIDNKDYATAQSLALSFNRFIQTSDEGFFIAGFYFDKSASQNLRIIKTDNTGNIVWDKKIPSQKGGEVLTITQRDDEGYSVLCRDGQEYNFDASGALENAHDIREQLNTGSTNLITTRDGGYLIGKSRYVSLPDNTGIVIEKTDKNGSEVWNSTLGACNQPYCYDILALHESMNQEYEVVYISFEKNNSSSDQDTNLIIRAVLDNNGQIIKQDITSAKELPEWVFSQAGNSPELISRMEVEISAVSSLSGHTDNQNNRIEYIIKTNDNGYAILSNIYYL